MYTCIGILITPIKENQMERTWDMKWKLGLYGGVIGVIV